MAIKIKYGNTIGGEYESMLVGVENSRVVYYSIYDDGACPKPDGCAGGLRGSLHLHFQR